MEVLFNSVGPNMTSNDVMTSKVTHGEKAHNDVKCES